jgi:hypothetical protein
MDMADISILKKIIAITCDTEQRMTDMLDIKNFDPIGVYQFSSSPGMQLFYPPVIEMLNFCYEQKFNRIHVLTPGPLGLVGLLITRMAKVDELLKSRIHLPKDWGL